MQLRDLEFDVFATGKLCHSHSSYLVLLVHHSAFLQPL
jgi:hypothetical protein